MCSKCEEARKDPAFCCGQEGLEAILSVVEAIKDDIFRLNLWAAENDVHPTVFHMALGWFYRAGTEHSIDVKELTRAQFDSFDTRLLASIKESLAQSKSQTVRVVHMEDLPQDVKQMLQSYIEAAKGGRVN